MKLTILIISCFCFVSPLIVCAQNHVGIILSGYEENCEVTHKGKVYECEERKELYMGDTVKKKPSVKSLKIKWAPYIKGAERGQTYLEVVANKPDTLKGSALMGAVKQYMSDFAKAPAFGTTAAVTRDPKGRLNAIVTLHKEYPLKITKTETPRTVAILDAKGQEVFKEHSKGGEVLINPKELNLNPGAKYMLTVTDNKTKSESTISLIDETFQNEITKGLNDIEKEKSSPQDTIIRKAAYFQLMSNAYPDKIDLYWLSNQLLDEIEAKAVKREQKEIIEGLRQSYSSHMRKIE